VPEMSLKLSDVNKMEVTSNYSLI